MTDEQEALLDTAIRYLDPDGGWDHLPHSYHNHHAIYRGLCLAMGRNWVETGENHDVQEWRLTDRGILLRAAMEEQNDRS